MTAFDDPSASTAELAAELEQGTPEELRRLIARIEVGPADPECMTDDELGSWWADRALHLASTLKAYLDEAEAPSDDPYCALHGQRFSPATGCPGCVPAMLGSDAWIDAQRARYDELTTAERRELALWVVARDIVRGA